MYDGIEYRGFGQEIVEELAKYSKVPVWNGLTNEFHPTQMLADMLTIREHFGYLKGIKLVYMGDARYNMGNSLMITCAKMGMHFVACTNKKYFPDPELIALCEGYAKESGATLTFTEDVMEGTKGAHVIYTDVWVSMGEPDEVWEERIRELSNYGLRAGGFTRCPVCGNPKASFMALVDDRFFRPTLGDLREWKNNRSKRDSKDIPADTSRNV